MIPWDPPRFLILSSSTGSIGPFCVKSATLSVRTDRKIIPNE